METPNDTIDVPKKEEEPVVKEKKTAKQYHREYYHNKLKGKFMCVHCEKVYQSTTSLRKHQATNQKCNNIRFKECVREWVQQMCNDNLPEVTLDKLQKLFKPNESNPPSS